MFYMSNHDVVYTQRTLETITIIVSATQLFSTCAIHAGVEDVIVRERGSTGRF